MATPAMEGLTVQPIIHFGSWRAACIVCALHFASPAASAVHASEMDDPLHRLAVQLSQQETHGPASTTAAPMAPIPATDAPRPAPPVSTTAVDGANPRPAHPASLSIDEPVQRATSAQPATGPRRLLHQSTFNADSEGESSVASTDRSGGSWILKTITALGVVIGLILLLRTVWTKMTGQATAVTHSPVVEVLSRTSIAPRNQVLLVRLGQRILVVGDSPAGLRTLASVDDPEEVASLLTAVSAARPNSISQNFSQLLQRFNGDYESQAIESEGGDSDEHRVDRARNSLSGLLARIRTVGAQS